MTARGLESRVASEVAMRGPSALRVATGCLIFVLLSLERANWQLRVPLFRPLLVSFALGGLVLLRGFLPLCELLARVEMVESRLLLLL